MAPSGPIATYETASSQIAIYGLEQDTDLQSLITTTGLNPAIEQTLSRLKGQRIAVVNLQTQPLSNGGDGTRTSTGQPGIHLAWTTVLASHSAGATYSYPLGTGTAWAHPIETTRIYVFAPPGVDFEVQYPRLGQDLSGYDDRTSLMGGGYSPRILNKTLRTDKSAYAADNAVGDYGRIWRLMYVKSNSAEDVVITRLPGLSQETQKELDSVRRQQRVLSSTWVISILVALAIWLLTWRYGMSRLLGVKYRWLDLRFWRDAFRWSIVYLLASLAVLAAAGIILLQFALQGGSPICLWVIGLAVGLVLFFTLPGLSLFSFGRAQSRALGVSEAQARGAYICVVLIANVVYLLFAAVYAAVVGAW